MSQHFTPVPKPKAALPKARAFGSSLPQATRAIGANAKRREREFARTYGSEERVEFIRDLPCVFCGRRPSENAHIRGGGAGRKADARLIVPACRTHHRAMHQHGVEALESDYSINLEAAADATEAAWQAAVQP